MCKELIEDLNALWEEEIPSDREDKCTLYLKINKKLEETLRCNGEIIDEAIRKTVKKCNNNIAIPLDKDLNDAIMKSFTRLQEIYHEYNVDKIAPKRYDKTEIK